MSGTDPAMTDPGLPGTDEPGEVTPRRGPDLLTLAVGLGALGIAGTTLLGGVIWLPEVDTRWLLASVALAVGLMLVISSFRHPRS
ncbi:MAG TPA: hypothetical protein VJT72_01890 [Pseudonocardiaceae bacterium]|nr:hypothetical protein [Pseudonocardiaceae bacterium]